MKATGPVSSIRFLTMAFALLLSLSVPLPLKAQVPESLPLAPVLSGLDRPVAVRPAGDGSGRLFIVEQAGRILVWDGSNPPTTFLDLRNLVDDSQNEQGLLGLDFHPEFSSNGFFFVNYTRDPGVGNDRTVVARYRVSDDDPNLADPSSAATILEIEQDFDNHNGGNILFGRVRNLPLKPS